MMNYNVVVIDSGSLKALTAFDGVASYKVYVQGVQ